MVRVLVHELFQGDVDAPHKNSNSILRHDLLVGMLIWQNSYHSQCDVKKLTDTATSVNEVTNMFASPFHILVLSSESMYLMSFVSVQSQQLPPKPITTT